MRNKKVTDYLMDDTYCFSPRRESISNGSMRHTISSPRLTSLNPYDPLSSHLVSKETRILLREGVSDGELVSLVRSQKFGVITELHQSRKITKEQKNIILRAACIYDAHSLIPLFEKALTREHIIECLKNSSTNTFSMLNSLNVTIEKKDVLQYGNKEILSLYHKLNPFKDFDLLIAAEHGNSSGFHWLREFIIVPSACGLLANGEVLKWICKNGPFHPLLGNRIIDTLGSLDLCIVLHKNSTIPIFEKEALIVATRRGNLKILKWLHSIGVRVMDEKISLIAQKYNYDRILLWLDMMNLPLSKEININSNKKKDTKKRVKDKKSGWSKSASI